MGHEELVAGNQLMIAATYARQNTAQSKSADAATSVRRQIDSARRTVAYGRNSPGFRPLAAALRYAFAFRRMKSRGPPETLPLLQTPPDIRDWPIPNSSDPIDQRGSMDARGLFGNCTQITIGRS